ncbi:MAG TPA: TIGR00725 family protein [Methanoregulaceae archaeon]|nr:TIGR00725 family protein [Methanoregulaceae archaeon]
MKSMDPVLHAPAVQVGVIGPADCTSDEYNAAETIGRIIAGQKGIICCGGLGGVMEAACRGARSAGGLTVGIVPDTGDGNDYLDVVIRTNLGHARNVVVAQTADALVAVGGAYGTLSELAIARKTGRSVFGYLSWEIPGVVACQTPADAAVRAIDAARRFRSNRNRRVFQG